MNASYLFDRYTQIRQRTESICKPLETEDYVVQPIADVSPPKWHIGHTTWFFETFLLKPYAKNYKVYDTDYDFVFNSYYESLGARVIRTDRGNLSRPTVSDVYKYRRYVDDAMKSFFTDHFLPELEEIVTLGLNHEEQHQELLFTDIKYILGHNPLLPAYGQQEDSAINGTCEVVHKDAGLYDIGYQGSDFCFDNELGVHKVYLPAFSIQQNLVSNGEYLAFIDAGGYHDFKYWHAEGWDWVRNNRFEAPMYWHQIEGKWHHYTLNGLQPVSENSLLNHISFYEASAYAAFKGMRLPTEFEWEVAAPQLLWGSRWEWTESAYLPYPGFSKAPGAIGEYNGKFMVNQKVLRGASQVTSPQHSRITYRNFFHPQLRWQYTGIRLAQ